MSGAGRYFCLMLALLFGCGDRGASAAERGDAGRDAANSASHAVPFVPGFERFARHGEIAQTAAGRLLISELSCTACHASDNAALAPKQGPDLSGIGNRVDPDWLRSFLLAPAEAKSGTTMPDCLAGLSEPQRQKTVTALVAYLSAQHEAFPEVRATGANPVPYRFWEKGDVERGEQLYHQIGCVACHAPAEDYDVSAIQTSQLDQMLEELSDEELEELGFASAARPVPSVPLPDLPAKYTSESLTHFLLAPEAVRPSGRMPNFQLQAVEAADLAAYLLRRGTEPQPARAQANEELRVQGQQLFQSIGCAHCHAVEGRSAPPMAKPLDHLDWSAEHRCDIAVGKQPHFALDQTQRSAIQAAIGTASTTDPAQANTAHLRMLQLNCFGCHARDDLGGVGRNRKGYFETVGHVDLGDEGRLPPPLTGVGRKLTGASMQQVLRGNGAIRPHMRIRMPKYPGDLVEPLPGSLAEADQSQPEDPFTLGSLAAKAGKKMELEELSEAGRRLLDSGCVQCHPMHGESLPGVAGVDLGEVTKRVRPSWFRDFVLDPGRLKPRTRMPTFFPDGNSQDPSLLDGDPQLQIAALWTYLDRSDRLPLPEKIREARAQDYELKPTGEPIVLRTFMRHAGTHSIAVGFPSSTHYAFDAESNRLALLWRGRFLDAQGTWFVRFAPPADPLGEALVLPQSFPFASLEADVHEGRWPAANEAGATFGGYRLDDAGVPTLLYRWKGWEIEDRIAPSDPQRFRRTLSLRRLPTASQNASEPAANAPTENLCFLAHAGTSLEAIDSTTKSDSQGLIVRLPEPLAAVAIERQVQGPEARQRTEWIVPLSRSSLPSSNGKSFDFEVQYEW